MDQPPLKETSGPALTLPLAQYWYISHAFRKELSRIEEELGVRINAEVLVSVTAVDQTRQDSVNTATRRVTDLVQTSMKNLQCAKIPHTQVESEIVKEVVQHIQIDRAKMMINMSAGQCLLFGPEPILAGVEEQMDLEPGVKLERSFVRSMSSKAETKQDLSKSARSARVKEDATGPIPRTYLLKQSLRLTCDLFPQLWISGSRLPKESERGAEGQRHRVKIQECTQFTSRSLKE
ncbi:hypothetical protein NFI96_022818, partial [Prochilodus magdalenae]